MAVAVQKAMAERSKRVEISQDWVIERLRENVDRAMQAKPVLDAKGNPTGEYTYQGHVANRGLELLGKHLGMFVDRTEIKASVNRTVRLLSEWSPEEIELAIKARDKLLALTDGSVLEGDVTGVSGND